MKLKKYNILFFIIIFILGIITINCMNKDSKNKKNNKDRNLSGNYILEYSFKADDIQNKFLQKGTVKPWTIVHDDDKVIIENTATGYAKDSTITFGGGPLNFGAGYGMANFKGINYGNTIIGTFSGTYYDPKYGTSKFSSASFVLKKMDEDNK